MSDHDLKKITLENNDFEQYKNLSVSIGLTPEVVSEVAQALEENNYKGAVDISLSLHPADTADLLEKLTSLNRSILVKKISKYIIPEVLPALSVPVLTEVLELLSNRRIVSILEKLETDDAAYVLEICEQPKRQKILMQTPKNIRSLLVQALDFEENTAGRLMQRDYVSVPLYWNIGQVIDYLRESRHIPDEFYALFVVDPKHTPVGTVPLHRAMRSSRNVSVLEVMTKEPKIIQVNTDQEDVAFVFDQYGLTSAPVVDLRGRLIGMITIDDVVDVIREEAEEDILRLGGVIADSDIYMAALQTARSRFLWLSLNLLTAIIASISIGFFSGTLEQMVALAILMPIVASMGGNAGTQTLTVAVRAMATRELTASNSIRIFGKEILVGAYNGVVFAVITGLVASLWFQDNFLGIVIALAMLFNLIIAGTFGAAIPMILSRYKIDPAIGATVILTTITDVIGFVVFLGLADLFLVS